MGANIDQNIEQILMQLQTLKQRSFEFTEKGGSSKEKDRFIWDLVAKSKLRQVGYMEEELLTVVPFAS